MPRVVGCDGAFSSLRWPFPNPAVLMAPARSLTDSFTHSLTHPLNHSFTHSLIHSPAHPPTHSPAHSLTRLFTHSFIYSFAHSVTRAHARKAGSVQSFPSFSRLFFSCLSFILSFIHARSLSFSLPLFLLSVFFLFFLSLSLSVLSCPVCLSLPPPPPLPPSLFLHALSIARNNPLLQWFLARWLCRACFVWR